MGGIGGEEHNKTEKLAQEEHETLKAAGTVRLVQDILARAIERTEAQVDKSIPTTAFQAQVEILLEGGSSW